ncbi:MAG: helix-turn-helix domain-containing protein [Streptosporangiales bacterium]|nr:helix-turn-helix domain-containing protein [Streptosporangiales bacterium]
MEPSARVVEALTDPDGRAAVGMGATGKVVRLVRKALLLDQVDVASRTGYSQSTISRVESGKITDGPVLADVGEALGIPPAALGLDDPARDGPIVGEVERRDLFKGAIAVASAAMLPAVIADTDRPQRVGAEAVAGCWSALHRLYELDDHQGGGAVYELTAGMAARMQRALARTSHTQATGRRLRAVTAATTVHAGWQALDAGRRDAARRWWLETLHVADLGPGAEEARVTALSGMALMANRDPAHGREAVGLAGAARSAAGSDATPTLLSMLAAREAMGYAGAGDNAEAIRALSASRRHLQQGRRGDEPAWLSFWCLADLETHATVVAERLNQPVTMERAAREAVRWSNPAMPRNHTIYSAYLGLVLTRLGKLDEAIATTRDALHGAAVGGSQRITTEIRDTARLLARQRYAPARDFAAAAKSVLPAA